MPALPKARNATPQVQVQVQVIEDFSKLERLPVTFQDLFAFFQQVPGANPFALRKETFSRIERITGRPLICYTTKTHNVSAGVPAYIDDSDLVGFGDLIQLAPGDTVDVFIVSNGGSAEAAERIVRLLRHRFKKAVRFIVPANAFSATTLMCFSGDEIIMDEMGTLGPIDPQINGVPAYAILRGFQTVEEKLKNEGPQGLTAYMPLISKYDLHIFEICRTAQQLSTELATNWLSDYMLKVSKDDPRIAEIVKFFSSYDVHKSHGRSIDRAKARELLGEERITYVEQIPGLADLVRSLYNQYEFWFDKTPRYKNFEDARGTGWGREAPTITLQLPIGGPPQGPVQLPTQVIS